jgi:hypothetical protein
MEVQAMPYVIRPSLPKPRLAGLLGAVVLAFMAMPAIADAACPTTPTKKAFQKFGDTADYSIVSNGHFESGTSGWSLTRASVVSGNEPHKVRSSTDAKSLAIQPTGVAVSPAFCVGIEHPNFRFFARRTSGTWGVLNVKLRWTGSNGQTNDTVVGSLSGDPYKSWLPSPKLPLATTLPLWQSGQTVSVRLVFDPEDYGGAWTIDDVYVDPYRR